MEPTNIPAEGSVDYTAKRLILWSARRSHGLSRVEWESARAREDVLNSLRSHFGSHLVEIAFPSEGTPFENVDQLFQIFGSTHARIVSITGLENVLAQDDGRLQTMAALSFRREALASFELVQIWWIPSVMVEQFVLGVPDLDSWFQLRLHLTTVVPEELVQQIGRSPRSVSEKEVSELAARFWQRFAVAQSSGVPLQRLWIELARPALAALFSAGRYAEAREIQSHFTDLVHNFQSELEKMAADAALLDSNDLQTVRAASDFATMLYVQGDLPNAQTLQELVLRIETSLLQEENADLAKAANDLAVTYFAKKDFVEAERLQALALARYRHVLGEEHPDTLAALSNLAAIFFAQGLVSRAREIQEPLVIAMERVLGNDDLNTIRVKASLAAVLVSLGELEQARKLISDVYNTVGLPRGNNVPETLAAFINTLSALPPHIRK